MWLLIGSRDQFVARELFCGSAFPLLSNLPGDFSALQCQLNPLVALLCWQFVDDRIVALKCKNSVAIFRLYYSFARKALVAYPHCG